MITTAAHGWTITRPTTATAKTHATLTRDILKIIDRSPAGIAEDRLIELADAVWSLWTQYPPADDRHVRVLIESGDQFDPDARDSFAYTVGGTGRITIRADVMAGETTGPVTNFMPVARRVPLWLYSLTHEWGHSITPMRQFRAHQDVWEEFVGGWLSNAYSLSAYGQDSPPEGYAEAFAEWELTEGRARNRSTRAYAEHYGWIKPLHSGRPSLQDLLTKIH